MQVDAPVSVAKYPAAQGVHTGEPVSLAPRPASQLVHRCAPNDAAPEPAAHELHALAPPVEYMPLSQTVHSDDAVEPTLSK